MWGLSLAVVYDPCIRAPFYKSDAPSNTSCKSAWVCWRGNGEKDRTHNSIILCYAFICHCIELHVRGDLEQSFYDVGIIHSMFALCTVLSRYAYLCEVVNCR